jgi:acyl carrier protein
MEIRMTQTDQELKASESINATTKRSEQKSPFQAANIQGWLVSYLADLLEIEPDQIDVTITFDRYGLDSSAAVGLTGDLGEWLGSELDPSIMYDYPTIETLVQHLSEERTNN